MENRIYIKDGKMVYFIKVEDVHMITSNGNYCVFHSRVIKPDKTIQKLGSLNVLEVVLRRYGFYRVSRDRIVNMSYVKYIEDGEVVMFGDDRYKCSRRGLVDINNKLDLDSVDNEVVSVVSDGYSGSFWVRFVRAVKSRVRRF